MTTEQAKFLTEAMGDCWHEWSDDPKHFNMFGDRIWEEWYCLKCKFHHSVLAYPINNFDYASSEGFFVLWNWAKAQDWFEEFCFPTNSWGRILDFDIELIHPDAFADAVYQFLEKGQE